MSIAGDIAADHQRAADEVEINALKDKIASLENELRAMEASKDAAYLERNMVVAALAKCFPSGVTKTAIEGWCEDWHGCVYIDLPTGQASWHFHDSHASLFAGIPNFYSRGWDGHTTEEKYARLAALIAQHSTIAPERRVIMTFTHPTKGDDYMCLAVDEALRELLQTSPYGSDVDEFEASNGVKITVAGATQLWPDEIVLTEPSARWPTSSVLTASGPKCMLTSAQAPLMAEYVDPDQPGELLDPGAGYADERAPIKIPGAIWPEPGKMEFDLERRDRDPMNMANRDDALKMPEDPVLPDD